jgi:hypothetical protein
VTRIRGQGRNYSRLSSHLLADPWQHAIAAVVVALTVAAPSLAEGKSPASKGKPAARSVAHKKASPEQVRKFNELAAKRHRETK